MKKEEYVALIQKFADKFIEEGEAKDAYMEMVDEMADIIEVMEDNRVPIEIVYTSEYNGGENSNGVMYEKDGDSGFDLRAQDNETGGYQIAPQSTIIVPVGIKVAVPEGFELQVRTRSGSPLKKGFNVANSPGTVDSGYRGVVGVLVHNLSPTETLIISCGERIAQGVIVPVMEAKFVEVDGLDITDRGEGAYNSTGVH